LDADTLTDALAPLDVDAALKRQLSAALDTDLSGEALWSAAMDFCGARLQQSARSWLAAQQVNLTAPPFKRPDLLAYLDAVTNHLERDSVVGKTNSVVDALEKAAYELQYIDPSSQPESQQQTVEEQNRSHYAVPDSVSAVAQVMTQLESTKKKDSLFHLVTRDYAEANIWIQLKSGDNRDMERVVALAEDYLAAQSAPIELQHGWAGLTYINVEWQDKMVYGMLTALVSSFIVVLIMMILLFRSVWFGVLALLPLTVTISLIYGLIGLVGKEYDMPVAVLSALTLGLSVDFAIHFLERAREMQKQHGRWQLAITHMFKEPATAISRNAIALSLGFSPLLLAPLVPYQTVGFFLAMIMIISWIATLFILAALVTVLRRRLFKDEPKLSDV
jgi:hypothetical protein